MRFFKAGVRIETQFDFMQQITKVHFHMLRQFLKRLSQSSEFFPEPP